jgi:hypothetical protein
VYTSVRVAIDPNKVIALASLSRDEVRSRLDGGGSLL